MFIEARKLIDLPVAAIDTGSKVGVIRKILIDPKNGELLGFVVNSGGIFSSLLVLSVIDIQEWDPNGIVTSSIDNLVPPKEIVRLNEVLTQKIDLFNLKAKTESGKSLGQVDNFLIDTATNSVTKYYLKDIIYGERVFSSDKVVKIDKVIIFSDDVDEIPPGTQGATALE